MGSMGRLLDVSAQEYPQHQGKCQWQSSVRTTGSTDAAVTVTQEDALSEAPQAVARRASESGGVSISAALAYLGTWGSTQRASALLDS